MVVALPHGSPANITAEVLPTRRQRWQKRERH
jgi:hypothetical protein